MEGYDDVNSANRNPHKRRAWGGLRKVDRVNGKVRRHKLEVETSIHKVQIMIVEKK